MTKSENFHMNRKSNKLSQIKSNKNSKFSVKMQIGEKYSFYNFVATNNSQLPLTTLKNQDPQFNQFDNVTSTDAISSALSSFIIGLLRTTEATTSYDHMNMSDNLNLTNIFDTNLSSQLSGLISDFVPYVLINFRFLFYLVWPTETMFAELEEVPRYVNEMFPAFAFIAVLEIFIRHLQGKNPLRINQSIASLSAGIFQETFRIKVRSIEVLMYCLIWKNFRLITLPWNSLWTWWLCYFGVELGFYWAHRIAHEVNFIWAIHQAHHSSEDFSIVSALRQAVLQPFTAWFTYVPLALLIPPQIFLAHLQLSELYMAWLHTEVIDNLGPLEFVLNCPSHHRVHHSRNREYIDKNYGGMLIIWDRVFGTFAAEDKQNNPPVYGLVHPVASFNPIYVQFHTWPVIWRQLRQSKNWTDKFKIIFYGPGWKPGLQQRLGNPDDIPRINRPIKTYDPIIKKWQSAYVVLHFATILLFYHELTIHQKRFNQSVLTANILAMLASITTLGMILDNKKYASACELIRCLLFFTIYSYISPVLLNSVSHFGTSNESRDFLLLSLTIRFLFTVSIAINTIHLTVFLISSIIKHKNLTSIFIKSNINLEKKIS